MTKHDPHTGDQRLTTEDDIFEAVFWRLSGWTTASIDVASDRLKKLVTSSIPMESSHTEIKTELERLPKDRRSPWSGLMAILVIVAYERGDERMFFFAAMDLMDSFRQSNKRRKRTETDALAELIREHVSEIPNIRPQDLWQDFQVQAQERWGGALVDSDGDRISFEKSPGDRIKDVGRSAFIRRVQREKRRQQPEGVAPSM